MAAGVHGPLFKVTAVEAGSPAELGENFGGWTSSYTGGPIPLEQMQEWRAAVMERIRGLGAARVLEIGVGSGLLLAQLAPHCVEYWGTDFCGRRFRRCRRRWHRSPGQIRYGY